VAAGGRARWLWVGAAGVAIAALGAAAWIAQRAPRGPERIVLVVVDTLRRDHVSAYDSKVETPNMAAFAARGQVFDNAVASFHQTSMSMAAMFTGRTPSIETGTPSAALPWNGTTWCGMARFRAGDDDSCVPRSLPTLAERLRAAGYWTIGVASNQFLYEPSGFARGFDDWTEVDERKPLTGPASRAGLQDARNSRTWKNVNRAVNAALARRRSDRFFLYAHYIDVHDYRFQDRSYAQAVQEMDVAFGRLLAALEAEDLLDGAVVVLTSDHGERLGEAHGLPGELPNNYGHYGNPSWQEMLRIPLIVAPPVFVDTKRLVRTQDLYGLVLEIAGQPATASVDTHPEELFVSELFFRTYREGRFKTTVRRSDGQAFLYDLEADPQERNDLAAGNALQVHAHRLRLNELSQQLAAAASPHRELSEEEKQRLRTLGYLEDEGGD
jgi:arylsulfatase A-like enzyme